MRLHTAEGVTELMAPANPLRRPCARARLTFGFAHFAHLRNWQNSRGDTADSYLGALTRLGFQLRNRIFRQRSKIAKNPQMPVVPVPVLQVRQN